MHVPFSLRLTPPVRLLLLTLADDPVYGDIEVQWARDDSGAEGMVVLAVHRRDGRADVCVQDTLSLPREDYDIGAGLASFRSVPFRAARFELTRRGVQLDAELPLADGRELRLAIDEARPGPRPLVRMLAPAGHAMTDPRFFPFFWMDDIWFLRWRGARVGVALDGRSRRVRRLAAPWQLTRYAVHPLTGVLCQQHEGPLPVVPDEPGDYTLEGSTVRVVAGPALHSITATRGEQSLSVRFEPPAPALTALPAGTTTGRFTLWAGQRPQLAGVFCILVSDSDVRLSLAIDQPWDPGPQPPAAKAVFRALRVFRTWPTTYLWNATVTPQGEALGMTSRWTRT